MESNLARIKSAYQVTTQRLLFLDVEGTLAPGDLKGNHPDDGLTELLLRITADSRNDVVLISRQSQEKLDAAFGPLPLTLVSENGGAYRTAGGLWQSLATADGPWKEPVERALQSLVKQYPLSSVEVKHFSIVWHYADMQIIPHTELKQLQVAWRSLARQHGLMLQEHYHSIEFIAPGISKGKFAAHWVGNHSGYDFIMAMGDDATDEDLFEVIGSNYFTIKVGGESGSRANMRLPRQGDVTLFLADLIRPNRDVIPK